MKAFIVTALLFLGEWTYCFSIPPFTQPVVDLAGMIHSRVEDSLNQDLASIYRSGGPQIAILTLPSLEDQTIEERAIQVFDEWKIGKKGKDNGVLILVAKKERKVRIEVGYGLEGDIPDAYAKRIVEDVMLPQFRNGQFTTGILMGVAQIGHLSHVDIRTPSKLRARGLGAPTFRETFAFWTFMVLGFFLIFLRWLTPREYRRGTFRGWDNWGGGGGFGGGSWGGGGGGSSGGGGASGGW